MTESEIPVAYIMSRFPKLTETFVLYEMLELRRLGFRVAVFPLRLEKEQVEHPEVREVGSEIFDAPLFSLRTAGINLKWLFIHPARYVRTWFCAVAETTGCLKFFAGAVLYFPKAVVFADTARRLGVAHIHAHFASHPALAAWVVHQLAGVPYSFTAHGTDLHVDQHMLPRKAADAAFAVTISRYNRRFITERCGIMAGERFETIRCGVDLSLFTPVPKKTESGRPLEILCVASFRTVKGHRILIDACAELHKREVPFRCRLIGYGPREKDVEQQIRELGLGEYVINEGPKSRPEVVRALGESDVLVLASVQTKNGSREGIPVSLMEGMACGLPIVASRISGIPELVEDGECGLLFPPGDSVAAADALERLFVDPQLRIQMGQCARRRVSESYDQSKNARVLAERIRSETERRRTAGVT